VSGPDPKDSNGNIIPPMAVPDTKVLHPLFGTYTRTETYNVGGQKPGTTYHLHAEAFLDDPIAKTWTVTKVARITEQHSVNPHLNKTVSHVHKVKAKVSFKEAASALADFEQQCKEKPHTFKVLFPDAPAMDFTHFKAFAEREGYVFDVQGQPHARPNARALPMGCIYNQEDVDSANKHAQRPDDEYNNDGPASRSPNASFVMEQFTRAAHSQDFNTATAGLRVLNILDRYVEQIEQAHKKMQEYCDKYEQLGQGDLITEAEKILKMAESSIAQLKAYGVETKQFASFLLQCQVTCHVLHAEGLYDLMNKGKGDFDTNEALFKVRVNSALESYKKIDDSDEGLKLLKNMIVQTPAPEVPATIGKFIDSYKLQRKAYEPRPAPPKPPIGQQRFKP
jgi:hypothetical protein